MSGKVVKIGISKKKGGKIEEFDLSEFNLGKKKYAFVDMLKEKDTDPRIKFKNTNWKAHHYHPLFHLVIF